MKALFAQALSASHQISTESAFPDTVLLQTCIEGRMFYKMSTPGRGYWNFCLPAIASLFFVVSYWVYHGSGGSDSAPMPEPGHSSTLHLTNMGVSLRFHDKFGLSLEQKVVPHAGPGLPERGPFRCRVQISIRAASGGGVWTFDQLHHAAEYYAGGTAIFASELFDVPAGQSIATISNLGCAAGQSNITGVISADPVGEHLLLPIEASILRLLGWITLTVWIVTCVVRYAKMKFKIAR